MRPSIAADGVVESGLQLGHNEGKYDAVGRRPLELSESKTMHMADPQKDVKAQLSPRRRPVLVIDVHA